jgi:hypothetical protein
MGGNERLPMPYKNNLREFSIVGMAIALRKKKLKKVKITIYNENKMY